MGPTHTESLHSVTEYPTRKPPDPRERPLIPRPSKRSDCPCSSDLATTRGGRGTLHGEVPRCRADLDSLPDRPTTPSLCHVGQGCGHL